MIEAAFGFVDENGKISLNYLTDEYKKGLEYIADLAKKKALGIIICEVVISKLGMLAFNV